MKIILAPLFLMPLDKDLEAQPAGVIRISNYEYKDDSLFWSLPTLNLRFSSKSIAEIWVKGLSEKPFTREDAEKIYHFLNVLNPQTLIVACTDSIVRGSAVALAIAEWRGEMETVKEIATGFSYIPHIDCLKILRQRFGLTSAELHRLYGELDLEPLVY